LRKQKNPFAAKYRGRDLWSWPIESSKIVYSQELHWRLAAKWNGLSFEAFLEYEGVDQSRMVAAYETSMMIEAVISSDSNRQMKRQQKKRR